MMRRRMLALAPALVVAALALGTVAATPAVVGPPWISIEYPVNPYDRDTKDAFLVVHTFHHQQPIGFPVSGRAEGLVQGKRRTLTLSFSTTSKDGVYTLTRQWPADGTWLLVIQTTQGAGEGNTVTAVVDLAADGAVAGVRVPTERRNNYTMPAAVTATDIDAALGRNSLRASR